MSRVKRTRSSLTPQGTAVLSVSRAVTRKTVDSPPSLAVTHAPIKVPHGRYKVLKVPREAHTAVPSLL